MVAEVCIQEQMHWMSAFECAWLQYRRCKTSLFPLVYKIWMADAGQMKDIRVSASLVIMLGRGCRAHLLAICQALKDRAYKRATSSEGVNAW